MTFQVTLEPVPKRVLNIEVSQKEASAIVDWLLEAEANKGTLGTIANIVQLRHAFEAVADGKDFPGY